MLFQLKLFCCRCKQATHFCWHKGFAWAVVIRPRSESETERSRARNRARESERDLPCERATISTIFFRVWGNTTHFENELKETLVVASTTIVQQQHAEKRLQSCAKTAINTV